MSGKNTSNVQLVVLQPGYLPWLGFFDQMMRADVFVCYDDVQFDRSGWRNRNRIKTPNGPMWLTVPVLQKGKFGQTNREVEIDNRRPWARKHVASIRQQYSRAPFLQDYLPELEALLLQPWERLLDLDLAVVELMASWMGIRRPVFLSSRLNCGGEASERLLTICRHFGADYYLSGSSARSYLDVELFKRHDIRVVWQDYRHPTYPQRHGTFLPYLSALDLVLNVGPKSADILSSQQKKAPTCEPS